MIDNTKGFLKKFFPAILLSAILLTGCTGKTESETAAAPETTTAPAVTTAELLPYETEPLADEVLESMEGIWIDDRGYFYEFRSDGTLTFDSGTYAAEGTYEYADELLKIKLFSPDGTSLFYKIEVSYDGEAVYFFYQRAAALSFDPRVAVTGYDYVNGGERRFTLMPAVPAGQEHFQGRMIVYSEREQEMVTCDGDGNRLTVFYDVPEIYEIAVSEGRNEADENTYYYANGVIFIRSEVPGESRAIFRCRPKPYPAELMTAEYLVTGKELDGRFEVVHGAGSYNPSGTEKPIDACVTADGTYFTITMGQGENAVTYSYEYEYTNNVIYLFGEGETIIIKKTKWDK